VKARPVILCFLLLLLPLSASAQNHLDDIWSYRQLYKNPANQYLQTLNLSGRAQADYAHYDADQGDYDDTRWRRFRFGFTADVLESAVIRVEADFDLNEDLRDSYKRLTDAHFEWQFENNWRLTALKQSAGFTLDGATSSKRLLTAERNTLTHNLWFTAEYFTGLDLKGACGDGWKCRAGLYSSDGNEELSKFDASYFSLLSVSRDLSKSWQQDKLNLRLDYVHNDKDSAANTRSFNEIVSLVAHWENGPWGLSTDITGGLGWEDQSDVLGLVFMPWWMQTPSLQWVGRYTFIGSSKNNGVRLNRYERDIVSGRGDEYHELFVGLNWFIYGHKLKWQNGLHYADMQDDAHDGGKYQGWGFISGLRLYW
jgi:phosphate-selective porin OprO/OprP